MITLIGYSNLKKLAEGRDRIIYSGLRSSDQQSVIVKALRSQLLKDRKLLEPMLPIPKGDFALEERNFEIGELFTSDVTTIHCTEDKAFTDDEVKEWARISSGKSHHFSLPGGHLSILENPLPFIKIVSDIAKGVL